MKKAFQYLMKLIRMIFGKPKESKVCVIDQTYWLSKI